MAAIKSGGLAAELGAELKATTVELEQLRLLSMMRPGAAQRAARNLRKPYTRMLKRLEEGGEVAQGVVRRLFPDGIWLYPDPNGGRFLWARAQTATPTDWPGQLDASGCPPAHQWPRIYNVLADETRNGLTLDESGSGGVL